MNLRPTTHTLLSLATRTNLSVSREALSLSVSHEISGTPKTVSKENVSSYFKCLKSEIVVGEVLGRRTIQHLLVSGRCWRAAAGSRFSSSNMVGMLLCVILRGKQENTRVEVCDVFLLLVRWNLEKSHGWCCFIFCMVFLIRLYIKHKTTSTLYSVPLSLCSAAFCSSTD